MGVERLDRLQPPGLALLALFLGPHDRLPVRREDQAGAGVGDFDAVAAGLVDIEEEGLLDRVLVRAGLDVDAVLEEDVGGAQDLLAAVERVGDVVEAAGRAGSGRGYRRSRRTCCSTSSSTSPASVPSLSTICSVSPQAEIVLEEQAVGLDVHREAIEVIEPADVDAARGKPLRLVLQRGLQFRRRLVPLGLVVELDDVAVGVAAAEGRPVPQVAVDPADVEAGSLQRGDAALQRLRAARAQRHVLHARGVRGGQLERIALVIVPAAQVDGIALLGR